MYQDEVNEMERCMFFNKYKEACNLRNSVQFSWSHRIETRREVLVASAWVHCFSQFATMERTCVFPVTLVVFVIFAFTFHISQAISVEKDLTLTFSQKQALDKFRARVDSLLKDDYMKLDIYLIRWLRARDFNLDAAEAMLRQNLKWRKENSIDQIGKEDFSDLVIDYPASIDTYDKQGRPIGTLDANDWNIRQAVLQGRGQRLVRYVVHLFENITQQVFEREALGQNVTQWKVLGSCAGFNLVTHGCPVCLPLWIQVVDILESYYHGWLDELIVIEATPAVNVVLDVIRPLLSRHNRDAIRIFSSNKAKWMPYLDERIDRSERRPRYGGTKPPEI